MLLERFQQGFTPSMGQAKVEGGIRKEASHFQVEEVLGFEPSGEGEHCFLLIQKTGENTEAVARKLARFAGLPARAVSYSGLKDRNAVTTQWFGVHLPKRDKLNWAELNNPNLKVLKQTWHLKKLRRGVHQTNRFKITVTDLSGNLDDLNTRLEQLKCTGVPNYFGEQRFGFGGQNLVKAEDFLCHGGPAPKRHLRGIYLSSARSLLFNSILSERVECNNWHSALAGDLMILEGTESFFLYDANDDTVPERLAALNVHPTGPMWGKGGVHPGHDVLAIEGRVLDTFQAVCDALEKKDLTMQRRSLRLVVNDLSWHFDNESEQSVTLCFALRRGGFATSVLSELIALR